MDMLRVEQVVDFPDFERVAHGKKNGLFAFDKRTGERFWQLETVTKTHIQKEKGAQHGSI